MNAFKSVKNSKGIDSEMSIRFGRAGYFLVKDVIEKYNDHCI